MYRKISFIFFSLLLSLGIFVQTADAYTTMHRYHVHLTWQNFSNALTQPTPTPTPTQLPLKQSGDSMQTYIMLAINQYRTSKGLSAVKMNNDTCNFATTRAQEIAVHFNHDGFTTRVTNHTLPYASYHLITENIAENSQYTDVVNEWIKSPGHAENMRADTPYVCVVANGNYYAYEGLRY